jgi:hypothetical protein
MIARIVLVACVATLFAGVATADPSAGPAAQQNARNFLAQQTAVRPDIAVSAEYDLIIGGLPMGSASVTIAPDQRDGRPCYRVEVVMQVQFGDQSSENLSRAWITPDFHALFEEQRETENGVVVRRHTITLQDGDTYEEMEQELDGPEVITTFAHQAGMLHSGMDVLLVYLLDRSAARNYAFTSYEAGMDPQPTVVVVSAPEQRTVAGVPTRVTPLSKTDTTGDEIKEFWFAFADDGRLLEWGGGDPEMPILFRLRGLAPAAETLDVAAIQRLAKPTDPVLLHFHGVVNGDAAVATSAIDAGRFAAYLVANDPALDEQALASGVAETAALEAISASVGGWPPEAVEMIRLLLVPGSFTVREAEADFARVTFNNELRAIPGLDTLEFLVERNAASGQWRMVLLGESPLQRAPALR